MTRIHFTDSIGKNILGRIHIPSRPKQGTAVIFPGYGYNAEAPLLYYLRMLFLQKGIQVINVDWEYSSNPDFQALDYQNQEARIQADTREIVRQVGRDKEILPLFWVGKSIGATGLLKALEVIPQMHGDRFVFLTPGFDLREAQLPGDFWGKAMMLMGSKDPFFLKPTWDGIDPRIQKHLVDRVDHQWTVEEDVFGSTKALEETLELVRDFL